MSEEPKFRYYKIEGEALELLVAYRAELLALIEDREKLEKEFMERADASRKHHQGNLRAMWGRLSASVGLDPEATWGSPEYQIEARYVDDGFGAILYMPRHINPARAELQGEPVGAPSSPETDIPDKDTTRH